jgi:hypothetical protein
MFVGKAGAYQSGAPFSFSFLGEVLGLAYRNWTSMEKSLMGTNALTYNNFLIMVVNIS